IVVIRSHAKDAAGYPHHILERRLAGTGGLFRTVGEPYRRTEGDRVAHGWLLHGRDRRAGVARTLFRVSPVPMPAAGALPQRSAFTHGLIRRYLTASASATASPGRLPGRLPERPGALRAESAKDAQTDGGETPARCRQGKMSPPDGVCRAHS